MNNEIKVMDFDPKAFGFSVIIDNGTRRYTSRTNEDYIIINFKRKDSPSLKERDLRISLCNDTGEMVEALLGETVNVGFNPTTGAFVLYSGKARRVSKCSSTHAKDGRMRRTIAISTECHAVLNHYGDFRRVFLEAKVYSNGQAILLTPTGERE